MGIRPEKFYTFHSCIGLCPYYEASVLLNIDIVNF